MKCLVTALFLALAILGWHPSIFYAGEGLSDLDAYSDAFYENDSDSASEASAEDAGSSSCMNELEISRYDHYYYYRHRVYESTMDVKSTTDHDAKIAEKPFMLPEWVASGLKAWVGFPAVGTVRWVAAASWQRFFSLPVMAN